MEISEAERLDLTARAVVAFVVSIRVGVIYQPEPVVLFGLEESDLDYKLMGVFRNQESARTIALGIIAAMRLGGALNGEPNDELLAFGSFQDPVPPALRDAIFRLRADWRARHLPDLFTSRAAG